MKLLFDNVRVRLAPFTLLANVEMTGSVTGIVGPSGAGKTTLLDVIAGIRKPDAGRLLMDSELLSDAAAGLFVPIQQRRIGYVPQDLALFSHFSVRRNLLYGHKDEFESHPLFRFDHVVEVLQIPGLLERGVEQLSGGEKQRVAIARALLSSPRLLLLDEPLSSLDTKLKEQIIGYLKRVRDEFDVPMRFVSHAASEVADLCDQIVELERGRVVQS